MVQICEAGWTAQRYPEIFPSGATVTLQLFIECFRFLMHKLTAHKTHLDSHVTWLCGFRQASLLQSLYFSPHCGPWRLALPGGSSWEPPSPSGHQVGRIFFTLLHSTLYNHCVLVFFIFYLYVSTHLWVRKLISLPWFYILLTVPSQFCLINHIFRYPLVTGLAFFCKDLENVEVLKLCVCFKTDFGTNE